MSTINRNLFIISGQNAAGSLDLNFASRSTTNTAVIGGSATCTIIFPKAGGGTVTLTSGASEVTFDSRANGQISFTMNTTKSAQLMVAPSLSYDVEIIDTGVTQGYRFEGLLEVKAIANT